jgi:Cytochrome c554 and c-prime
MSYSLRQMLIIIGIIVLICGMSLIPYSNVAHPFHSMEEIKAFRQHAVMDIVDSSLYFAPSYHCKGCHSTDPQGFALVDGDGNDVAMYDAWASSMMANAARDPFWRAKVSHETFTHPDYKDETENKCTSCHAPLGNYTARYHGDPHYGMDELLLDTMGLDGVSCSACHQMSATALGDLNSGLLNYDTNRVQYGPYPLPFAAPMSDFVGFTPVFSTHINDAGICASCHTLVTETFDLSGQPNGDTYIEQATYHEWLNSQYNVDNISCQACHMARIADSVVISDNFNALQPRFPYGLHDLVGANTMMLQLMRDNRVALGINATVENYNKTIAATLDMLQNQTLDLSMELTDATLDTLFLELKLKNKAGHKFPSGYPSRRAFVELQVISLADGETLFHSGKINNNNEVVGLDPNFEPHYDVINQEDQVQIYEIVPADVNANFTTILERAAFSLKDNRLPPLGFKTNHAVYDTTLIVGNALTDPDFNFENGEEGSATDRIRYHVSRSDFNGGFVKVIARVHYQSLPPRWLEEMFAVNTPEIQTFKDMYNEADQSAVLVETATLDSVFMDFIVSNKNSAFANQWQLSPNPTNDGRIQISIPENHQLRAVEVYQLDGKKVETYNRRDIQLPPQQGVYLVRVVTHKGEWSGKVVRF